MPRLPYTTYTSSDDIPIRVGRSAAENDALTCDPRYRDDADWWLHVAGFSGPHVVVCCTDDELPTQYPNTLKEAAYLAYPKSPPGMRVPVTYTRCGYVTKRPRAPTGLVETENARELVVSTRRPADWTRLTSTKT